MRAIYLHGFASGPSSTAKGNRLRELCLPEISNFTLPALEGESFYSMTWDIMVAQARAQFCE